MNIRYLLYGLGFMFLASCTTADTTGNISDREYDVAIEIFVAENGMVEFSSPVMGASESSTDQDTENSAEMDVSPSTAVGLNGGTASLAAEGGKVLVDLFQQWQAAQEATPPIVIPNKPPSKIPTVPTLTKPDPPTVPQARFTPYETGLYKDGRQRYLFRTTMEAMPDVFYVLYDGATLYTINKAEGKYSITDTGGRWEFAGRSGSILKNTHGRKENVTLLLSKNMPKGEVALAY